MSNRGNIFVPTPALTGLSGMVGEAVPLLTPEATAALWLTYAQNILEPINEWTDVIGGYDFQNGVRPALVATGVDFEKDLSQWMYNDSTNDIQFTATHNVGTIIAKFNREAIGGKSLLAFVIKASEGDNNWRLGITGAEKWRITSEIAGVTRYVETTNTISGGNNVVVSYSNGSNYEIWINGIKETTLIENTPGANDGVWHNNVAWNRLKIGRNQANNYWDGIISEIGIWGHATVNILSEADIVLQSDAMGLRA